MHRNCNGKGKNGRKTGACTSQRRFRRPFFRTKNRPSLVNIAHATPPAAPPIAAPRPPFLDHPLAGWLPPRRRAARAMRAAHAAGIRAAPPPRTVCAPDPRAPGANRRPARAAPMMALAREALRNPRKMRMAPGWVGDIGGGGVEAGAGGSARPCERRRGWPPPACVGQGSMIDIAHIGAAAGAGGCAAPKIKSQRLRLEKMVRASPLDNPKIYRNIGEQIRPPVAIVQNFHFWRFLPLKWRFTRYCHG